MLRLAFSKRFFGYFFAQLLGAFNDNLCKAAVIFLAVYQGLGFFDFSSEQTTYIATAIFIFPFVLFSATAGQMADRYSKTKMIRFLKGWEFLLSLVACVGFWIPSGELLMLVLAMLGVQSAFFGPMKFAIIPILIKEEDIVSANSLVSSGTNLVILLGTLVGGQITKYENGLFYISLMMVATALCGFVMSFFIPKTAESDPNLKVNYLNWFKATMGITSKAMKHPKVLKAILGSCWFWFVGSMLISMATPYAKNVLMGSEDVTSWLLALFSIGTALGAALYNWWCDGELDLGIVPVAVVMMSICLGSLALLGPMPSLEQGQLYSLSEFLGFARGVGVSLCLVCLATSAGLFLVPLVSYIQKETPEEERSQIIAGGNILSSTVVVGCQLYLLGLNSLDFSTLQIFALTAGINLVAAVFFYREIPSRTIRFLFASVRLVFYNLKIKGKENLPEGPVLLVCNHISWIDWWLIGTSIVRPVRFVMWYEYFRWPIVGKVFRDGRVIPIATRSAEPDVLKRAYEIISEELAEGNVVLIFPEGGISRDGKLQPFRPGIEKMVARDQVPVVPLCLKGLWGSPFSRHPDSLGSKLWNHVKRLRPTVELEFGEAIYPPKDLEKGKSFVKKEELFEKVQELVQKPSFLDE